MNYKGEACMIVLMFAELFSRQRTGRQILYGFHVRRGKKRALRMISGEELECPSAILLKLKNPSLLLVLFVLVLLLIRGVGGIVAIGEKYRSSTSVGR
jgi:hypothetical protein